jgi:hypothetical protein
MCGCDICGFRDPLGCYRVQVVPRDAPSFERTVCGACCEDIWRDSSTDNCDVRISMWSWPSESDRWSWLKEGF